jgi:hypothetical protein
VSAALLECVGGPWCGRQVLTREREIIVALFARPALTPPAPDAALFREGRYRQRLTMSGVVLQWQGE